MEFTVDTIDHLLPLSLFTCRGNCKWCTKSNDVERSDRPSDPRKKNDHQEMEPYREYLNTKYHDTDADPGPNAAPTSQGG